MMRELTDQERQLVLDAFRAGWSAHSNRFSAPDPSLSHAERSFLRHAKVTK